MRIVYVMVIAMIIFRMHMDITEWPLLPNEQLTIIVICQMMTIQRTKKQQQQQKPVWLKNCSAMANNCLFTIQNSLWIRQNRMHIFYELRNLFNNININACICVCVYK